jgi:hypothetical protein
MTKGDRLKVLNLTLQVNLQLRLPKAWVMISEAAGGFV